MTLANAEKGQGEPISRRTALVRPIQNALVLKGTEFMDRVGAAITSWRDDAVAPYWPVRIRTERRDTIKAILVCWSSNSNWKLNAGVYMRPVFFHDSPQAKRSGACMFLRRTMPK